jgi:RNA polymerase sigma factor (sigma-70 family)
MDQVTDSSLVELAKDGDQAAFAELYNRYFDPVYDFIARMTRNRDEAEDIAQDTFLKAMNALGGLQKGASFKSWIFTIARNTALNRLEKSSRTRPLHFEDSEGEEVSFDVVDTDRFSDPEEAAQASAVAALVWQAAAGLDPKQLSLLDLHLRQGLDSGEIADVLGVTKNNGYVMLNRLKKAVEDSIGAFIMFKDGRQYCGDLNAVLSRVDIDGMSPEVRKVVERHVAQCSSCEERKKKLAPLAAFAGLGAIGAPAGAKAHILEGLLQQWPGPAAVGGSGGSGSGGSAGGGAGPGGGSGGMGGANGFLKVGGVLTAAAGFLMMALLIPASPVALTRGDEPVQASPTDVVAAPTETPTNTPPGGSGGGAMDTPTPEPTPNEAGTPQAQQSQTETPTAGSTVVNTPPPTQGPATATSTPSPTATATPSPTATTTPTATATSTPTTAPPTATPTPPPCVPELAAFGSTTINVPPGSTQNFIVFNTQSCAGAFELGSPSEPWLSVSPTGGSVPANGQVAISVFVSASQLPQNEGTHTASFAVQGIANSFVVNVSSTRGGQPPQVIRASGSCATSGQIGAGAQVNFTAEATDDIAVVSVIVRWTKNGSPDQVSLQHNQGTNWRINQFKDAFGGTGFTAVATDGAGRTHSLAFTPGQC